MNRRILIGALVGALLLLAPGLLQARWMNPNTGRFWTMDTFEGDQEEPRSLHKYYYCQANPTSGTDPTGQQETASEAAAEAISAGLDGQLQPATSKLPAQTVAVDITAVIRPPNRLPPGVKTKHVVAVNQSGAIVKTIWQLGPTDLVLAAPEGLGNHTESASFSYPVVTVYMGATAHPRVTPPPLSIRYDFEVQIDFLAHNGHLSGFHELFPSYTVSVKGTKVYDFQQQRPSGLSRFNLVRPEVDFKW